ncbi:DapH/DapD/GlmU-related protein [Paenibacillus methanolicus]|uniref:Carbon dioxide concentrating mechanism protein CcmM n=1 Tax=Paenibacillus methanolicus TaxID=582686 RepID=A0A5S5C252_9BACL|nr:DapH/DapD/GlmU-related protein [Paenibacillus methanolicus]TYP73377.1 carbon dioxide concentrating mechanism protein CcmM [Paenibacillus methanolicus]
MTLPAGPYNQFVRFIGVNPATPFHAESLSPRIAPTAFIGPFSSVIGGVAIGDRVFVAPNVSIRADEGTPFHIGEGSNLQDGVILHGLKDGRVLVGGQPYSIYVDRSVSLAHGAIVHGPAYIGEQSFVGFQSLVFQAIVGSNVHIANNAVVIGNVTIANDRFVPPGAMIDTQEKADRLKPIPQDKEAFAAEVQRVNREFAASYSLMFGKRRCSCGIACDA